LIEGNWVRDLLGLLIFNGRTIEPFRRKEKQHAKAEHLFLSARSGDVILAARRDRLRAIGISISLLGACFLHDDYLQYFESKTREARLALSSEHSGNERK